MRGTKRLQGLIQNMHNKLLVGFPALWESYWFPSWWQQYTQHRNSLQLFDDFSFQWTFTNIISFDPHHNPGGETQKRLEFYATNEETKRKIL